MNVSIKDCAVAVLAFIAFYGLISFGIGHLFGVI